MQNTQKETDPQPTPAPVTVTLDQAKELDRPLTMNDALIITGCKKRERK